VTLGQIKVLQTPARFYPYVGGTEQVVLQLSKELVRNGFQVKVVCAAEPAAGDASVDGVAVRRLPYIVKIANTNITPALACALLRDKCDVIHTHLPHPWSADVSAVVATIKKKPLFVTYHNDLAGKGWHRILTATYNLTALTMLLHAARKIFITSDQYIERSSFLLQPISNGSR